MNKLTQDLCDAAQDGYVDVVRLLLDRGAEVNGKASGGMTTIHYAAWFAHADVVRLLLDRGAEVNVKDNTGLTPLHFAAKDVYVDVIMLLLNRGADVNAKDNDGWTPLHDATWDGHADVAVLLLDRGAQVNGKTIGGWTPLHYAAWDGYVHVAVVLLDRGAEVNCKDNKGKTPLRFAIGLGHVDVVRLLLDRGAEVNCKDNAGLTPIHYAAWNGRSVVATLLLGRGAEVNVKDNEGWTPLDYATWKGHADVVALLLERGAEINCEIKFKNGKGETALGLAEKQEIRNYLVKRGAKKEEEKGEFLKKGEIGYDTTTAGVITSCEIVSTILEHTSVVVISKMLDDKRNISSIVVNKYMQFSFFSLVFFDKSDVEIKLIYVHTKASALRVEKLLTGALNKILQYLAGQKIATTDNVDAPVRQNYDIVKKACEDALEEQKSNDEI